MEKPRQIAFRILERHGQGHDYLEDVLASELQRNTLPARDRRLVHELVCGVVRSQRALDWLVDSRSDNRPQQPIVRILLRLGLYQLLWLDRIPAHAAVHETVELAKDLKLGPIAGFINAFLRAITQDLEHHRKSLEELSSTHPDIRYSHPEWLWLRWKERLGSDTAAALLKWNNLPPSTYARLNTLKSTATTLEAQWSQEGVVFAPREFDWASQVKVYELTEHPPLTELTSFQNGGFYIQDPSTLLAVSLLDPQPGETVLDQCAAPGGKTTLIAQRMQNQGRVVALDTHRARILKIKENCTRLGVSIAQVLTATGVSHPELSVAFDRVLVDAPCSNTGVMRRRIDIRWRLTQEEILRLQTLQKELLTEGALQLKPGGTLVYSTCSLEIEENQHVTQWFLSQHPQFTLQAQRQLSPTQHHVDGAYAASFTRLAQNSR